MFDFTNYTFCFVTTLVASLLGITYPLLIDVVRKLNNDYDSTAITEQFQKEKVYCAYQRSLFPVALFIFAAPFTMLLFKHHVINVIVICTLCIIVFLFLCIIMHLFLLVIAYTTPSKLVAYLCSKAENDSDNDDFLVCILDLMLYSARRGNNDVYAVAKKAFISLIWKKQPIEAHKGYTLTVRTRNNIVRFIQRANKEKITLISNDDLIEQIFYNSFIKGYNELGNFQTIWQVLYYMVEVDNFDWFKHFWMQALQYYSFYIELGDYDFVVSKEGKEYKRMYLEFHTMVGAMLVHNEKYDWLNFMLTKDRKEPASYSLTLSTFNDIFNFIKDIEKQKEYPKILTAKYQMQGMYYDMDSDDQIMICVYRFCALLIIRLFSYQNNVNRHYQLSFDMPPIPSSAFEIKEQSAWVSQLRNEVENFWYQNKRIEKVKIPGLVNQDEVFSLIDLFKLKLINAQLNPKLNVKRLVDWSKQIVTLDNEARAKENSSFIGENNKHEWMINSIVMSMEEQLNPEISTSEYVDDSETLLSALQSNIESIAIGIYERINPSNEFHIYEQNLFKALERLKLNDDYVIISLGINLFSLATLMKYENINQTDSMFNDKTPIVWYNSGLRSLLIVHKDDLHKVNYVEASKEELGENMSALKNSRYYLYSDIDRVINDGNVNDILTIRRKVEMYFKRSFKCCVRINVKYEESDVDDLTKIVKIGHCLCKCNNE